MEERKKTLLNLLEENMPFEIKAEEHLLKKYFKILVNLIFASFWCLFSLAGVLMPLGIIYLILMFLWSILITIF